MKVVHVNTYQELGGAAVAAGRLVMGQQARGIEASMACMMPGKEGKNVAAWSGRLPAAFNRYRPFLESLPLVPYRDKTVTHWSADWWPHKTAPFINQLGADLVHLHWINHGFVTVEDVADLRAPVVWTLHDSWAFTGGCHLPMGCAKYRQQCGACPRLGSQREHDISRKLHVRKSRFWKVLPLTIVCPSQWLANEARSSSLLGRKRIEVIPNGIDTELFTPADKLAARKALDLPADKKLLLVAAYNPGDDPNKGLDLIQAAGQLLARDGKGGDLQFVVAGAPQHAVLPDLGLPVVSAGQVRGGESMAQLYNACDLLVHGSRQENLPNVIMEAMSCGKPVCAFRVGGIPEMVEHGVEGWLAEPEDAESLAGAICGALQDDRLVESGSAARSRVLNHYGLLDIADRHQKLYEELIAEASAS